MPALLTSWSGACVAPGLSGTQPTLRPRARVHRTASVPTRFCQGAARSGVLNGAGSKYSTYPPLVIDPPALCDSAWMHSYRTWVAAAIQEPVGISSTGGEAWSSKVHILGTSHHNPCNPRAIQEVAAAMQPDAITCELPDGMRNIIRRVADSHPLASILDKVMSIPITSMRQAHCQLLTREDRIKWELGLRTQNISIAGEGLHHYVRGKPEQSECLAAVRVARKRGATLSMMDTDEQGRKAFKAALHGATSPSSRPAADLACSFSSAAPAPAPEGSSPGSSEIQGADPAFLRNLAAALTPFRNPALSASFLRWLSEMKAASGLYPELVEEFIQQTCVEALTPAQFRTYRRLTPFGAELQAANDSRERAMAQRIRELCSGSLTGKPCKRVLVITGKSHVLPLRTLLASSPSNGI